MHAFNMTVENEYFALDNMANTIKVPEIYGTFADDKHYLATLDLLLAATNETENRYAFFNNHVLPCVSKHSMIDAGIGDGKLTVQMAEHFQEITLVDPSAHALNSINQHMDTKNKKISKIVSSIENVNLSANQYDLAILSHTLYYIDTKLWVNVASNMLSSLKKDGLLVIVLNGGLDKDDIANQFGGTCLGINKFAEDCQNQLHSTSVKLTRSTEYFRTKKLSAMLHIVGLHLYDVGARATREQLTDYLIAKKNKPNDIYQFLVYQNFILIRK